jgi:hypothetical protein
MKMINQWYTKLPLPEMLLYWQVAGWGVSIAVNCFNGINCHWTFAKFIITRRGNHFWSGWEVEWNDCMNRLEWGTYSRGKESRWCLQGPLLKIR